MRLPPPITSRTNAKVKALRAALSGDARQPGDLLGLEGPNLIREGHQAGMSFDTVFVREGSEAVLEGVVAPGETLRTASWAVLAPAVFEAAVTTNTPQGIAATWVIEEPKLRDLRSGVTLVLENIQDPGNLGTLIRSATAFGVGQVLLTQECVNAWNPKVVRAAAGASFLTPVRRAPLAAIVEKLRAEGVRLFAAVSGFQRGREFGQPIMAAAHGVLTGRVDALDASGGSGQGYAASLSYDTDFVERCAIMIGNEGAGLSVEARSLADEQVLIPCSVESLNAAVAGSVLMYEAMRQMPLRRWAQQRGLRP